MTEDTNNLPLGGTLPLGGKLGYAALRRAVQEAIERSNLPPDLPGRPGR